MLSGVEAVPQPSWLVAWRVDLGFTRLTGTGGLEDKQLS